jgi:esterase/lipase superfamily enzyme
MHLDVFFGEEEALGLVVETTERILLITPPAKRAGPVNVRVQLGGQRSYTLVDAYIYEEVVPLIRQDCTSPGIEVLVTGASIGAFNAVAALCRHPDAFWLALGMSGTYDLSNYLQGRWNEDFYFSSPLHYLPGLGDGWQLDALRRRFIIAATGSGRWEDPGESWRLADVLGSRGIPNRVDDWGPAYDHDWPTWREMLPKYLAELS